MLRTFLSTTLAALLLLAGPSSASACSPAEYYVASVDTSDLPACLRMSGASEPAGWERAVVNVRNRCDDNVQLSCGGPCSCAPETLTPGERVELHVSPPEFDEAQCSVGWRIADERGAADLGVRWESSGCGSYCSFTAPHPGRGGLPGWASIFVLCSCLFVLRPSAGRRNLRPPTK